MTDGSFQHRFDQASTAHIHDDAGFGEFGLVGGIHN
jgi:hypothetical protein